MGPYEILSALGAGGMGEVYRATDTKLGRDVAIKVLPEEFFEVEERRARFEREAKLLATLNHPGIASIHSFEEIPGPGYMSPEQVKGRAADTRSDIFSFGAILYEMLSGQRAFHRETAAETISAILKEDPPDLSMTSQSVPPGLERLVAHCLEKNPEQRFRSAHDLAFDLESLVGASGTGVRAPASAVGNRWTRRRVVLPAAAALATLTLAAGFLTGRASVRAAAGPPQFTRLTFRRGLVQSARFAPDGETVVYGASWEGAPFEIFVTRADARESRTLGLGNADIFALSGKGDLAIFRVNVRTGQRELARQLTPLDAAGVSAIDLIRMTADGKAYVYS